MINRNDPAGAEAEKNISGATSLTTRHPVTGLASHHPA